MRHHLTVLLHHIQVWTHLFLLYVYVCWALLQNVYLDFWLVFDLICILTCVTFVFKYFIIAVIFCCTGFVCMALVVMGICCYTACQKRAKRDRRDYYFTPLPQKLLFDGDDKEEELFRTPLTGKCVLHWTANFAVALFSDFI